MRELACLMRGKIQYGHGVGAGHRWQGGAFGKVHLITLAHGSTETKRSEFCLLSRRPGG